MSKRKDGTYTQSRRPKISVNLNQHTLSILEAIKAKFEKQLKRKFTKTEIIEAIIIAQNDTDDM